MSFLQRKLTKVWQGLFDGSIGVNIRDYIPGEITLSELVKDYDLGIGIPMGSVFYLNDVPVGNAKASVPVLRAGNLNNVKLPDGHREIELNGDRAAIYIELPNISVNGSWNIKQVVNSWTTKKKGFITIPWRENRVKTFSGTFSITSSGTVHLKLKGAVNPNPDLPLTVGVESIVLDMPRFNVNFCGADGDSKLVAGIANLIQRFSDFLYNKIIAVLREYEFGLKEKIRGGINSGLEKIWNSPL